MLFIKTRPSSGTYDFYALNHYTSRVIRKAKEGEKFRPWPLGDAIDLNGIVERRPDWSQTASFWFYVSILLFLPAINYITHWFSGRKCSTSA